MNTPINEAAERSLEDQKRDMEAQAKAHNGDRKPKFGDSMRNPWAGETNPQRDGYFVREKRVTGRFNPGLWYQMTDRKGNFWEMNGKVALFIDARAALPPSVRLNEQAYINMAGMARGLGYGNVFSALSALKCFIERENTASASAPSDGAADARDGARYRWLRMQDWFESPLCVLSEPKKTLTQPSGLGADCPSRERLDSAIDAAIASTHTTTGGENE